MIEVTKYYCRQSINIKSIIKSSTLHSSPTLWGDFILQEFCGLSRRVWNMGNKNTPVRKERGLWGLLGGFISSQKLFQQIHLQLFYCARWYLENLVPVNCILVMLHHSILVNLLLVSMLYHSIYTKHYNPFSVGR